MALSYVTYTAPGGTTDFSVTFDYINQGHVSVYLDGVLKTVTTDYSWFNSTTIRFNSAVSGGVIVRIQRDTPNTARLVDFQDAGNLTEVDLDTNSDQNFFIAQEITDGFDDLALQLDTDNKWDAENKIIKNVAEPTSSTDAGTKNYIDGKWTTSLATVAAAVAATAADVVSTNADAASTAADAVSTAADAAATAADLVQTNLDQISCAADAVSTAADAAATAADVVSTNADAASTAADAISTAADAASTAADAISTAADAAATAADLVATDADQISCAADAASASASASAAAASAASVDSSEMLNRKNRIINGCMRVWQRGATFSGITAGAYVADKWSIYNNIGTLTCDRKLSVVSSDKPFYEYLEMGVSSTASVSAGSYANVTTRLEGTDVADFRAGKASAETVTLSFWHKHTVTGTYTVAVRNDSNTRTYVQEYTQTYTNAWEKEELTFTMDTDTGSTWLYGKGVLGLSVTFNLAAGSNFHITADTWTSSAAVSTSNQVNGLSSTSNKFGLANVQLEKNPSATVFEKRSFNEEFRLCERYYEKSYNLSTVPGTANNDGIEVVQLSGLNTAAKTVGSNVRFRTQKAFQPTVVTYSNGSGTSGKCYDYNSAGDLTTTLAVQSVNGFKWLTTTGSYANVNVALQWTAESEIT